MRELMWEIFERTFVLSCSDYHFKKIAFLFKILIVIIESTFSINLVYTPSLVNLIKSRFTDQESLQLQFVIEKSKTESEVKAREEYLLLQKEKLEQELMLLKSEKKGCVTDDESKSQNSSTSSVCGYTSEGGAKENECAGAAAALLFEEFGSIQICDNSLELLKTKESLGHDVCCAMSLVQQVTEGFQTLNMFEAHADLVKKLLEIVKSVDSGKNFDGIELMHLIDYDDLIESYLKILTDQLE